VSTTAPVHITDSTIRRRRGRRPAIMSEEAVAARVRQPAPTVERAPNDWPPLLGFGRAARAERERRGWSLTEFARTTGIAPDDLHAIEAGEADPTFHTISRIAEGLAMRPSHLVALGESETTWMLGGIPF
jgi:ribosome-binding protein aMBF1 (putative translation factor)